MCVRELEIRLVKSCLVWPTAFLMLTFAIGYWRIRRPKTPSANKALVKQEALQRWAERVYAQMAIQNNE